MKQNKRPKIVDYAPLTRHTEVSVIQFSNYDEFEKVISTKKIKKMDSLYLKWLIKI